MATSAPEKVTVRRLEGWRRHDRVIAVAIGAVLVVIAYFGVTYAYRSTHWFQESSYMDGYGVGEHLRDDTPDDEVNHDERDCITAGEAIRPHSGEYGSAQRSGFHAWMEGCVAAVRGEPADTSDAGMNGDG